MNVEKSNVKQCAENREQQRKKEQEKRLQMYEEKRKELQQK